MAATLPKNNNCGSDVTEMPITTAKENRLKRLRNTHALVSGENKADFSIQYHGEDPLQQPQVYEPEVKGMYSSSSSTQNMAFGRDILLGRCKAPKIQDNKNKAAQDRSVPVNIYFHSFGVIESGLASYMTE
ncbi:hypothetical protein Tco_1446942 [Tanacetum coccineum]